MVGLLGQILGGMIVGRLGGRARRRGGGSMVMNGLLIALAVKAAREYGRRKGEARSFAPDPQVPAGDQSAATPPPGGLAGMLGSLGGAGALTALLNQLRSSGLAAEVESWIKPGPNLPVTPQKLAASLGEDSVETLSEETGMPRDALLQELSDTLPEAVDELTPEGHEPSDSELGQVAGTA